MIKPWTKIESLALADFRLFSVRSERKRAPDSRVEHDFVTIDCPNWVNVVAVTPQDELVMVEQYRHGSETVELEIPGGMIDPEDASPITAGLRELREETGYAGHSERLLTQIYPNPAIMSNLCYTVMVEQCTQQHPTAFDHGEDLITRLVPVRELPELVRGGQIRHSLVVVALYHFELARQVATTHRSARS